MRRKIQFYRLTDLSLEINNLDFHISLDKIGDLFFLNLNTGWLECGCSAWWRASGNPSSPATGCCLLPEGRQERKTTNNTSTVILFYSILLKQQPTDIITTLACLDDKVKIYDKWKDDPWNIRGSIENLRWASLTLAPVRNLGIVQVKDRRSNTNCCTDILMVALKNRPFPELPKVVKTTILRYNWLII